MKYFDDIPEDIKTAIEELTPSDYGCDLFSQYLLCYQGFPEGTMDGFSTNTLERDCVKNFREVFCPTRRLLIKGWLYCDIGKNEDVFWAIFL